MRFIRAITIDDAALVSSTVAETVAAYNPATAYSIGQQVRRDTTHRIYESRVDANTGNTPEDSPDQWLDAGPTNRWAMFDTSNTTQTSAADEIVVVIQATGRTNGLALFNLDNVVSVTIVCEAEEEEVYNQTFELTADGGITDWYAWFFEDLSRRRQLTVLDLPIHTDMLITVTLTGEGTIACGSLDMGHVAYLGDTQFGMRIGQRDFSRKERTVFGAAQLLQRDYARTGSFVFWVDNGRVDFVADLLDEIRATVAVFITTNIDGAAYNGVTAIRGWINDWNVEIKNSAQSLFSTDIEGLT
jgi:hypothetical protein